MTTLDSSKSLLLELSRGMIITTLAECSPSLSDDTSAAGVVTVAAVEGSGDRGLIAPVFQKEREGESRHRIESWILRDCIMMVHAFSEMESQHHVIKRVIAFSRKIRQPIRSHARYNYF